MEKRVLFNSSKIRDLFFDEILKVYELENWKDFAIKFKKNRTVLGSYRSGKLTLPESFFSCLTEKFNKKKFKFFNNYISKLDENWGRVKGGHVTYNKYNNIFVRGRKKGLKLLIKKSEKESKFNIWMPLNQNLSYFIGLFLGDGFTNNYNGHYLTQFIGHKDEYLYYVNVISKISNELFNIVPIIKNNVNLNYIRVNFHSKKLFYFLTKRFKIPYGRKSLNFLTPDSIMRSSDNILAAFIAGICDAEGYVFFDKRASYKQAYPRFGIHMHNVNFINQLCTLFKRQGIRYCVNNKGDAIIVYGINAVKEFLEKIPIMNPKNIGKFRKVFGDGWRDNHYNFIHDEFGLVLTNIK